MPFKNTAPFLRECIDSILGQSIDEWELLAVNDGSTDESVKIVEYYASKDQRIRVLQNESVGIISALQTATKHASGTFITRMDSDDIMHKRKLEHKRRLLIKHGQGTLATGQVKYFSSHKVGSGYLHYQNWLNKLTLKNTHWDEIFKECVIPSPCWMMYRNDFMNVGGFEGTTYPEDYHFTFRLWEKRIKVVSSTETLLYWREHPNRTSRNDVRFTDPYFTHLKVKYFLKHVYQTEKKLVVWGAGNKAKDIVRELDSKEIPLVWISANPGKVDNRIGNHLLLSQDKLKELSSYQHIITFVDSKSQEELRILMQKSSLVEMKDYFFFG